MSTPVPEESTPLTLDALRRLFDEMKKPQAIIPPAMVGSAASEVLERAGFEVIESKFVPDDGCVYFLRRPDRIIVPEGMETRP